MADIQPPPTYAEVALVDDKTGKTVFNPVWLKWFLDLTETLNEAGGTTILHNALPDLQGGTAAEFYHMTAAEDAQVAVITAAVTANRVFAGPAVAPAAVPTFRALVAADLPAGTGTVTSVGITGSDGIGVAGSPITTNGSITLSLGNITPDNITQVSGGKVIIGHTASVAAAGGNEPQLQVLGTSAATARQGLYRFSADANAPTMQGLKSRNASVGSHTVVQSGDTVLTLSGAGSDGTNFIPAAAISFVIDGTPGTNDMPGAIYFSCTADGASAVTDVGKWDQAGHLLIGSTTSYAGAGGNEPHLQIHGTDAATARQANYRWSNNANAPTMQGLKSRGGLGTHTIVSQNDNLFSVNAAGSDGSAFILAGDITFFCDGTPGSNDMPGGIIFSTTADGASAVTEAARINSNQILVIAKHLRYSGGIVTETGATHTLADTTNFFIANRAGTVTVTLPAASAHTGRAVFFRTIQAQRIDSAASDVVPRNGGAAATGITNNTDGAWVMLVSDGSNWQQTAGTP